MNRWKLPLLAVAAFACCLTSIAHAQTHADAKAAEARPADAQALITAAKALTGHVMGDNDLLKLSNENIQAHTKTITDNQAALGESGEALQACVEFIKAYDAKLKPLFIGQKQLNKRDRKPEEAIHWASLYVMQAIIDEVYDNAGMKKHGRIIDGLKFETADYFPGKVDAKLDSESVHTIKIQGSYPITWGAPVFHGERPARKPTGTYLVPGAIATVTVPESLVNKGYQIRVGAHSWDLTRKPRVNRLYRVTTLFDIDATEMKVSSPLGGGIYIEVPEKADAGVVEVSIKGAVRSPFFSFKSFHKTTNKEWAEVERNHKAPWADFQSDKFMMQVPTSWIYKLEDPAQLMTDWDKAMDICNDLMGRPRLFGKETLYTQVDTQLRGRAFHPGYPAGNGRYDPRRDYGGAHTNHLVRGPKYAHSYELHELGHAFLFVKYAGDREAAVNLPHATVMNVGFGMDMNEALRSSRTDGNEFRTMETTALAWMMSDNFVGDGLMRGFERQYQLKGHAKYIDIARLFGWEALGKFWKSTHQDYMDGKPWPRNVANELSDKKTLRMSQMAGADLSPLIHFWGIPPHDSKKLAADMKKAGVPRSAKVYDQLMKYKKLIPANNAEFRDYAKKWWGKEPSPKGYTTQRNHAARWNSYDEKMADQVRTRLQVIIDYYFPNGRPEEAK